MGLSFNSISQICWDATGYCWPQSFASLVIPIVLLASASIFIIDFIIKYRRKRRLEPERYSISSFLTRFALFMTADPKPITPKRWAIEYIFNWVMLLVGIGIVYYCRTNILVIVAPIIPLAFGYLIYLLHQPDNQPWRKPSVPNEPAPTVRVDPHTSPKSAADISDIAKKLAEEYKK